MVGALPDNCRQVIDYVRRARQELQNVTGKLQIYMTAQGQAVSNGTQNAFLPRTFSPWSETVFIDWSKLPRAVAIFIFDMCCS